jgi:hypothetical protein
MMVACGFQRLPFCTNKSVGSHCRNPHMSETWRF